MTSDKKFIALINAKNDEELRNAISQLTDFQKETIIMALVKMHKGVLPTRTARDPLMENAD